VHLIWQENMCAPPQKLPLPKILTALRPARRPGHRPVRGSNLLTDRKEERDVAAYNSWVADPAVRIIGELEASFKKYPPIKLGTPDPTRRRSRFPGSDACKLSVREFQKLIGFNDITFFWQN
jgi:hypothetical protein